MNKRKDLVKFEFKDEKMANNHGKTLGELSTLFEPEHESGLHNHFKEIYIHYLESLTNIDGNHMDQYNRDKPHLDNLISQMLISHHQHMHKKVEINRTKIKGSCQSILRVICL